MVILYASCYTILRGDSQFKEDDGYDLIKSH